VKTLLGGDGVAELPECLGGAKHAVDRARTSRANQGSQVRLPSVHARAAKAAGRAPDRHEGVADGDHALPAPASQGGAVSILPHTNGDIDVSVLELLLDDVEMSPP